METVPQTLIDKKVTKKTAFDNETLSVDFQASEAIEVCGASKGTLIIQYDRGEEEPSSTFIAKIEFSHNGTDWFQESSGTTVHDEVTHILDPGCDTGKKLAIPFDIPPVGYMRVSIRETNILNNSGKVTLIVSWMP